MGVSETYSGSSRRFLGTDYNILIVDSSKERREAVCKLLYGYGVSTDEAENRSVAEYLIGAHTYDMVLIGDALSTEDMSAVAQAVMAVTDAGGRFPVLAAVVGQLSDSGREEYMRLGFREVIVAPYDEEALGGILDKWIPENRRRYYEQAGGGGDVSDADMVRLFMSGVDVLSAMQQYDNVEDYLELLDVFYVDGEKRMVSFEEKIESEDFSNYIIEVHGLKSAAANIGAGRLSELSKQHEMLGKASDFDSIRENKKVLLDTYQSVLLEIKRVLQRYEYGQFAKRDDSALMSIEQADMLTRIRQAYEAVVSFHSKDAAKTVEELLGYKLPDTVREELEQIQVMLKMYEDDEAETKLDAILQRY